MFELVAYVTQADREREVSADLRRRQALKTHDAVTAPIRVESGRIADRRPHTGGVRVVRP